ncbi:hypothetical protein EDD15DRAFT_186543 [Pisolithus albus]|nr:hypothetical protein EDD15DRAFT_186543 [Pisolithus albus]
MKSETSTPALGGFKPATGFGAFGVAGTTTSGSSRGAFSSPGTTPTVESGAFGPTIYASGSFGTGENPADQSKPAVFAFGRQPTTGKDNREPAVTTGTASPPYSVYQERDPLNGCPLQYQTISVMPAYRSASLEELRVQDYQQDRKSKDALGKPPATQQPTTSSMPNSGQRREYVKPPLETGTGHDGMRILPIGFCPELDYDATNVRRKIVDEHESAGEGLANALRKQSQSHDEKLRILRADMEAAMKAQKEEIRQEVLEELERKREEVERLKRDVECMTERFVSEKTRLESRIAEMEATHRQHVDRLQDMQNQVSQALLQVMASQTETARRREEEERQARLLAEERLANALASTKHHEEVHAVQAEMNKHLYALQDEISRITLEKKGNRQRQADPDSTKTYTNGQSKDRETKPKQKEREN